ncbi:MAG TPA: hypothetical protein VMA32_10360 [Streptosporangiaceae bacterium]|nr:hypothetical protein [Streptosporangiaceae bacterium]
MRAWVRTGTWLARRFALDRNPLRRRSDRVEAWTLLAMTVAFVPLSALTAATTSRWIEQSGGRELAGQTLREVRATLLQAAATATPLTGSVSFPVRARWLADGATHLGLVRALAGTPRGTTVQIWVTRGGEVARQPLTRSQLEGRVATADVFAPAAVALAMCLLMSVLRWLLDRHRQASWGASWTSFGPRWSQRL